MGDLGNEGSITLSPWKADGPQEEVGPTRLVRTDVEGEPRYLIELSYSHPGRDHWRVFERREAQVVGERPRWRTMATIRGTLGVVCQCADIQIRARGHNLQECSDFWATVPSAEPVEWVYCPRYASALVLSGRWQEQTMQGAVERTGAAASSRMGGYIMGTVLACSDWGVLTAVNCGIVGTEL